MSNTELQEVAKYFQIPHYLFLRKCVAIREQLQLMGYPNSKLQIRNIPVGSANYYACFTECCRASGYKVQKNEKGEVTAVIPFSKLKFEEEEIEENEEASEEVGSEDELVDYFHDLATYTIVEPSNVELYVYDDEKIDFIASTDYTLKKIQAAQAIDEIENESAQIFVNTTQITAWIKRHHDFYWSMEMDYNVLAFRPFQNLYYWFQFLADNFKKIEKAQQAVDEYKPFDEAWLYKYDRLYYCALMGWGDFYEVFHDDPFILKREFDNLYLVGEEFKGLYYFSKLFLQEEKRQEEQ